MIINICQELEDKIYKFKKINTANNDAALLGNCQKFINDAKEVLHALNQQTILYQNNELIDIIDIPDTTKSLDKLHTVQQNFKEDAIKITRGKNFNLLIKYLNDFHSELSEELKTKWNDWLDKKTQFAIDETLLDIFKNIPDVQEKIEEIDLLYEKLNESRGSIPSTQKEIDDIKQLIESIREIINSIPLDDLPEDVQKFLTALNTSTGASLDYLTEIVMDWLKDKNLTSNYFIRPKRRFKFNV